MEEINNLCPNCLSEKTEGKECPQCGWQDGAGSESPLYLVPGTILNGQYFIGRVLGHGGFGITYLAYDLNLNIKLAIKEYLPRDSATRTAGEPTISVFGGSSKEQFRYGLDKFLEEARVLARFQQHPGIVSVLNFFSAHDTGYMVMEYVEGQDFNKYLNTHGGKLSFEKALSILMPAMDALREVHSGGLLHRDIAPDNIYITGTGQIKLLDFGAARFAMGEHSRSLSVVLKPGYAPEEQYRSQGKQGSWSDVYAMTATLYRAVTGQLPPEALDRLDEDELKAPSALGITIPANVEQAMIKGLAVRATGRYQDMGELQKALTSQAVKPEKKKTPLKSERKKPVSPAVPADIKIKPVEKPSTLSTSTNTSSHWQWVMPTAFIILLVGGVYWYILEKSRQRYDEWNDRQTERVQQSREKKTTQEKLKLEQEHKQEQQSKLGKPGSLSDGRYKDNGDGTVTDLKTRLQWMRCSVGQKWIDIGCSGKAKEMKWKAATEEAANMAGQDDWRLPTSKELKTLIYCSNARPDYYSNGADFDLDSKDYGCGGEPDKQHISPTVNIGAFPNTPVTGHWSSSAHASSGKATTVLFSYGAFSYKAKDDIGYVRLVRGGEQKNETYTLMVVTKPATAKVRILNIGPKYSDGIQLSPGRYHIEVAANGYEKYNQWISLENTNKVLKVPLKPARKLIKRKLIDGRYEDNFDGTVIDIKTKLQWMRCSVGQTWTGSKCRGEAKKMKWEVATKEAVIMAGFSDWRLPTIEELLTLVYCSNGKPDYYSNGIDFDKASDDRGCGGEPHKDHVSPTINAAAFPESSTFLYWSSTSVSSYLPEAFDVSFAFGQISSFNKTIGVNVRLVRSITIKNGTS